MDINIFGAPCSHISDCNKHLKHSICSENICICKGDYRYNVLKNECSRMKNYGEKCGPNDECHQDYLICSPFGFCSCSTGYYFNSQQKPLCQLFQNVNNTAYNFNHCESGFFWSHRRQRCVRAKPGHNSDMDIWIHDHHSMIRPRYSFFTFTIIIICLMIILKRRSRKPSSLGNVPRIYNQNIVANEINLNQLRSPVLFSSSCYETRRQRRDNRQSFDSDFNPNNVQPPPPYEETAAINLNNSNNTNTSNNLLNTSSNTIVDAPPSYEQAIKMQPLQQASDTEQQQQGEQEKSTVDNNQMTTIDLSNENSSSTNDLNPLSVAINMPSTSNCPLSK